MRPRWIVPVVLVVVLVTAAAGLVARAAYTRSVEAATSALVPNENPVPPANQPGDPTVTATNDAAAHPLYEPVRDVLQTFFDSINSRDYDQWLAVVTADRAARQLEDVWRRDYSTSKDGSIVVHRIESGPTGKARVLLRFTSTQDPALAPPEFREGCIRWRVVWPFTLLNGAWKLDAGLTGLAAQTDHC